MVWVGIKIASRMSLFPFSLTNNKMWKNVSSFALIFTIFSCRLLAYRPLVLNFFMWCDVMYERDMCAWSYYYYVNILSVGVSFRSYSTVRFRFEMGLDNLTTAIDDEISSKQWMPWLVRIQFLEKVAPVWLSRSKHLRLTVVCAENVKSRTLKEVYFIRVLYTYFSKLFMHACFHFE